MEGLSVNIGANTSALTSGIATASSQISSFVSGASSRLLSLGDSFSAVGQKLSIGLSVPLGLLSKQLLENGGGLESLKMGLKSIEEQQYGVGKSSEYAAARYNEYVQLAKLPGIGLKEAVAMSISLRSVGFSADESKREIIAFGNALALVGKGKNELNGVSLQIQQLSGKASGFGADLRVIKEYAPQVGGALLKAFGTIDTEAIAKTGVTGKQVIEKITAELEKLPRAGAGMKNAMENVYDSIFITTGRIGVALNKALGLNAIFDKIGNGLANLAAKFENLSPTTQKFIGIVGGLLVIVPLILTAVGALTIAFTYLVGPIGLIVAGIAALTYVIVSNWESITDYLKETGVWDGLVSMVTNTWDLISSIFKLAAGIVIGIFSVFSFIIERDAFGTFSTLSSIIGAAFEIIGGITKTIAGIMSGDWAKMGNGLIKISTGVFNVIMTIAEGFMLALIGVFKQPFVWVGMDAVVKTFNDGASALKTQFQGFRTELNKFGNDVEVKSKEIVKNLVNINSAFGKLVVDNLASSNLGNVLGSGYLFKNEATVEGGKGGATPAGAGTGLDKDALKKAEKAAKDTEDLLVKLAEFKANIIEDELKKFIDGEVAKYEKEKNSIERTKANAQVKFATLQALESSHNKNILDITSDAKKKESEFVINSLTHQVVKERALQQLSFEEKLKNVPKIIQGIANQNKAIELLEIEHQAKMKEIQSKGNMTSLQSNLTKNGKIGDKNTDGSDGFGQFQGFKNGLNIGNPIDSLTKSLTNSLPKLKTQINAFLETLQEWKDNQKGILQNTAIGAFQGIGNVLGAIATGAAKFSDIGKVLVEAASRMFSDFGAMLIERGVMMLPLQALLTNPLTSAFALIAVGTALSAVGAAGASTFSGGGSSSSGGGSSAGSYSQNYSSGSSGGSNSYNGARGQTLTLNLNMSGETRLQGNDLVTSIKRTEKQQVRIRG